MSCNCNQDFSGLRDKRSEIQEEMIESEHPGWRAWTTCQYKGQMRNAIDRTIQRTDWLTEEQLEQACLALGITKLP